MKNKIRGEIKKILFRNNEWNVWDNEVIRAKVYIKKEDSFWWKEKKELAHEIAREVLLGHGFPKEIRFSVEVATREED